MFIKDMYKAKKPVISFEVFPPKYEEDNKTILDTIKDLSTIKPDFISVTCSTCQLNNDKEIELASIIKSVYGIEVLAHFTCIGLTDEIILSKIKKLKDNNIENILALRGDVKEGIKCRSNNKHNYAIGLINDIKKVGGFCVGAAAYPEGHIECDDNRISAIHLKHKVDAGVDFLITQLFFDNKLFYEFLNLKEKLSIKIPISAGIMPILSKDQIEKMIFKCGVSLPSNIVKLLYKYEHNPKSLRKAGIEYATEQVIDLMSNGVDGIHIYTMNQPEVAKKILQNK